MRRGARAIFFTLLVLCPWLLRSQTPKPPSLEEQLRAQYEPQTVLTIQKEGILGVAPTTNKACPASYQDAKLNLPDVSCTAPLKSSSRPLTVGEKVYPSKVDVDLAREKISLQIVECDSCNEQSPASSYKSQIEFQFGKGYLENASVSQVVDAISEVLTFQEVADQPPEQSGQQTAAVLTNNDVVKMVKVKLGDNIIISTIKGSQCNFDMTVDGMVMLKTAGVSDPVIQAMRDAQEAATAAANAPAPPPESQPDAAPVAARVPGQMSFSVRHRHSAFAQNLFSQSSRTEYYCAGTLSVSPDGTVAYDCAHTGDPSGRCEHISFAPGSLKQVKLGFGGSLHLESKAQGKFDFYGKHDDIKQALAAIAPLTQTTQK